MTRAACRLLLVATLGVFGGCGPLPTTRYYLLEPQHLAVLPASEGLTVGILPFQVDAPYDQDRIVYRVGEDSPEVGYYAYHRWATPLSRMLPRIVAAAFDSVSGISSIEPAVPGRDYDATLRGRVLTLEEVDGPAGARVRISLALTLVRPDDKVIWADSLVSEEPARATTQVSRIVERFRTTLGKLLDESATGLASSLAQ